MTYLSPTLGLGTLVSMDPKPWRERIIEEERLLEQLRILASESASRRAQALRDGVADLGTIAAVARDLGRSWQAVDQALRRDQKKTSTQDATTTE